MMNDNDDPNANETLPNMSSVCGWMFVKKYQDYYRPTTAKTECLEVESRTQRDSFLWRMHRKGHITDTAVHMKCYVESTDPTALVSKNYGILPLTCPQIKP